MKLKNGRIEEPKNGRMEWQMTKWNEECLNDCFFIPLHSPFLISFINFSILTFIHYFYSLWDEWWL